MNNTKIEWSEITWNPITGCSKISPGCRNCYAERMSKRLAGRFGYPSENPFQITFHPDRLKEPLKWKKPKMIFVSSMGDIFHPEVEPVQLVKIFEVIKDCPQHTFLILTKRPHVMLKHANNAMLSGFFNLPNLWLGVSVEEQDRADERIPYLLEVPASVHFVSIEPMLGPVDLTNIDLGDKVTKGYGPRRIIWDVLGGIEHQYNPGQKPKPMPEQYPRITANNKQFKLDWVICGGETGPKARAMHPDWVRDLRDQCKAARIPFLFKQWGEWADYTNINKKNYCEDFIFTSNDKFLGGGHPKHGGLVKPNWKERGGAWMCKVGKKKAGRLLDGHIWNEYPVN